MKNLILMHEFLPLGDTRNLFWIWKYIISMKKGAIQIAILRILVAALAFLIRISQKINAN